MIIIADRQMNQKLQCLVDGIVDAMSASQWAKPPKKQSVGAYFWQ